MIVVFDSGIWISALQFGGVPMSSISHALLEDRLLYCTQFEDEIVRVMGRKFSRSPESVRTRMEAFLKGSIRVVVPGAITGICRDPKDDFVLECATLGRADLIVTGDKDLLSLGSFEGIRIVTAREYLDIPLE